MEPARVRAQSFTLALGGDVIFDAPIEYVLRARGASPDDARSYEELFADLRGPLEDADLSLVNLETPVGPRVRERSEARDYPTFAAPPAFLEALAASGVDVVTVANNHAYDQGVAGLAQTLTHAERVGLLASGTDEAPGYTISHVHGLRVAVASFTQGTNHRVSHDEAATPRVQFLEAERLASRLRHARANADVVVAALHFTDTGERMPTRSMRAWAVRAADAGADLVVGHGPHVPARSEWLSVGGRRVLVLHSLGNLLAAMQAADHAERSPGVHVRDSLVITLRITVARGQVTLAPLHIAPFWIEAARTGRGTTPFTRPVAIDARRSDALGVRARRLTALLTPADTEPASLVAASTPTVAATPAAPSRPATTTTTRVATRSAQVASGGTGDALGVAFLCGSARESSIDTARLSGWAARMRAEPGLQLEVTSSRCEGEAESLALRRARRAAGLLALLGPSRSRLSWRVGEASAGAPQLSARARASAP